MNQQNWQKGDVLLDQYEVLGTLGEGGMGTVYKVHHQGWNIDLAVKSSQPAIFARAGGRENFIREAETWVNLALHPHIVGCYYVRMVDDLPLLFAEYVAGGNLADWIRSRRLYEGGPQQALERMLEVAIQFAWGLHTAHEQGLIHQDIKPANVMMTTDGMAKVTDFGLAKARAMAGELGSEQSREQQSILVSSRGMTPAYCSPEQAAGKALNRKTDIWSWGVSMLEMFVGEVTWRSGMLAREVLASYAPRDAAIAPLPAELVTLLARCFASQPEERPATMLEVATTLQEIYEQELGHAYSRQMPRPAKMVADTLNNRALSLYDLGKVEEAFRTWEQALQIDPHHLETIYNRGVALWRRAEITDDALVTQLETVRAAQKDHWRPSYLLSQVYLEQGEVEKAYQLHQDAAIQASTEREVQRLLKEVNAANAMHLLFHSVFPVGEEIYSMDLSADGRWLASVSGDRTVRLWEISTGRCLHTFEGHTGSVTSVSLSADGRWLASGSRDRTVRLWETSTGRCLHILRGQLSSITSVCLSADGRWLASGNEGGAVYLWETSTGRHLHIFEGYIYEADSVSLSADGRWLAASFALDNMVRLWETSTGRCLHTLQGHTDHVASVSLSADGCWLASGSWDKTVRLWEVSTGRCLHILRGHVGEVTSVSLSADGRWIVSASGDRTVRLWETSTGRCLHTFPGQPIFKKLVSLSADGRWLVRNDKENIYLWKHFDFRAVFSLSRVRPQADITQAELEATRLLAQFEHAWNENRISDALQLTLQLRALPGWKRHPESLGAVKKLSTVCSPIRFNAICSTRIINGPASVDLVGLSANGHWLLTSSGNAKETRIVRLWEVSTGRCLRTFEGHTDSVTSVSLSANGRWLASGSWDRTVRLWEMSTGRCLRIFEGHADWISSVSLSADGRWLVSGSKDKTVRLWEMHTGRCLRIFEGHSDEVGSVSLSADGRWLATESQDKTVRLWEVSTGRCLRIFEGRPDWICSVSLSADGRWLVSGSYDKTMRLWELDWELEAHEPVEWDEGARSYLEIFLTQHTPYVAELPHDREPTEQDIEQALTHKGTPTWNEEDFQALICQLQYTGYGWLQPEGVRRKLVELAAANTGATIATRETKHLAETGKPKAQTPPTSHPAEPASDSKHLAEPASDSKHPAEPASDSKHPAKPRGGFQGHQARVTSVALSTDGRLALSGSEDQTLRLWEVPSGRCLQVFTGHRAGVTAICLSADGKQVLSGSKDKTMRLWEIPTGRCLHTFQGYPGAVSAVSLSRDGQIALSANTFGTLRLWDVATERCMSYIQGAGNVVGGVLLSEDGELVVSGNDTGTIQIWQRRAGHLLRTLQGHTGAVTSLHAHFDTTVILSGSLDTTMRLWDVNTGRCLHIYERHRMAVTSVSLGAHGELALSGSEDGTVQIWEIASGRCLSTLTLEHRQAITSVCLSTDGRLVLSGQVDGSVRLWTLDRSRWKKARHS